MKINILQGAFFPVPALRGSAIEKAWDTLGQSFANQGHQVTHISRKCDGLPSSEYIGNVQHIRVPGYDAVSNILFLKLKEFFYVLRAKKVLLEADILITHAFWAPILLPKAKFGRIYVHVGRYPKGQLRFYKKAACFQVPTNAIARAVQNEIKDRNKQISVLPYPLKWKVNSKPNYLERDFKILYLGRIHPEKGITELVHAFRNISPSIRKQWKLHLRGPWKTEQGGAGKKYLDYIKKISNECNADIEIHSPFFSDKEIKGELESTKVFVYPSRAERGETFGLSVLEAMSCGCVPLVSSLDCFADFVKEEETGYIFNHKSKDPPKSFTAVFSKVLKSESKNTLISGRCIELAKEFEVEKVSKNYLMDFSKLLSNKND
jgi:glycosyltransferase involved in cell wall biosynthesis